MTAITARNWMQSLTNKDALTRSMRKASGWLHATRKIEDLATGRAGRGRAGLFSLIS